MANGRGPMEQAMIDLISAWLLKGTITNTGIGCPRQLYLCQSDYAALHSEMGNRTDPHAPVIGFQIGQVLAHVYADDSMVPARGTMRATNGTFLDVTAALEIEKDKRQ